MTINKEITLSMAFSHNWIQDCPPHPHIQNILRGLWFWRWMKLLWWLEQIWVMCLKNLARKGSQAESTLCLLRVSLPQWIWHQTGAGSRKNRNVGFRKMLFCGSLIWDSISFSFFKGKGSSWGLKECLSVAPTGVIQGETWNFNQTGGRGRL